jgi:hypothetical protein
MADTGYVLEFDRAALARMGVTPPYSDSMTADQLGLDEAMLRQIVTETDARISEMDSLNTQVMSLAPEIQRYMGSDAGKIMAVKLNDWVTDYRALRTDLTGLNRRVVHVLHRLLAAHGQAVGIAQQGMPLLGAPQPR